MALMELSHDTESTAGKDRQETAFQHSCWREYARLHHKDLLPDTVSRVTRDTCGWCSAGQLRIVRQGRSSGCGFCLGCADSRRMVDAAGLLACIFMLVQTAALIQGAPMNGPLKYSQLLPSHRSMQHVVFGAHRSEFAIQKYALAS